MDKAELARLAAALGGLPVLACRPGSLAERAGVRYGDIVVAVNGIKTPDWAAFIEARALDAAKMTFELVREGTRMKIEIPLDAVAVDPPSLLAEITGDRSIPIDVLIGDATKRN